jgi:hypothetical protein
METRDMMISEEVRYFQGGGPVTRREDGEVADRSVDDSLEGTIPLRYRDGVAGIDLEQVRRDQLRARRQVVRAIIRRLEKFQRRSWNAVGVNTLSLAVGSEDAVKPRLYSIKPRIVI